MFKIVKISIFFKEINTFIQQGHIKLIQSDSKSIYSVIKDFSFNEMLFFWTLNNNDEQKICIFEWFLKNHVTLKTAVIMLKIQFCITGINYILKYI